MGEEKELGGNCMCLLESKHEEINRKSLLFEETMNVYMCGTSVCKNKLKKKQSLM